MRPRLWSTGTEGHPDEEKHVLAKSEGPKLDAILFVVGETSERAHTNYLYTYGGMQCHFSACHSTK